MKVIIEIPDDAEMISVKSAKYESYNALTDTVKYDTSIESYYVSDLHKADKTCAGCKSDSSGGRGTRCKDYKPIESEDTNHD